MSKDLKNYYAILGIPENASLFDIESAYEKLASKWHPDKNKEHRKSAEMKFQEIAEAYEVLSDRNKRSHYDELLNKKYSLEDANKTFERFFNQEGILDEKEEKFFSQNYPSPLTNYYNVLGVPKTATMDQIKEAYRKLSMQYHPKANPGNDEACKKFVEVNKAYNALCDEFRRENYDQWMFGEMVPMKAHDIFEDFFGNRWSVLDESFKPLFHNRWVRDLDKMMLDEGDELKGIKEGQSMKTSSVYTNKDGKESGKTVTTKRTIKNGKMKEETVEDYLLPSGERKVIKSINDNGKF